LVHVVQAIQTETTTMRMIKRLIPLVVVLGVIGGGCWWWFYGRETGQAIQYRTAAVSKGDLVATIGATGTLEPEEVTDVGAQVAAQIVSFGTDKEGKEIDYSSQVEKGMVLAKLDPEIYKASKLEADAQLAQAEAGVIRAKADLDAVKAKAYAAERDWQRAERIGPSDALAQSTYDNYKSTYEQTKANVGVAEAAVKVALATVEQAKSAVARAQRNLDFTVITSPETGTVIDRRVNIGQTVTSNMSVASLFLIARDLKRMQIWASVNEADIGQIRVGQPVTFTVDAFPGETFKGVVGKIRLNAQMTQNVVTYTVEVNTENPSYRLMPYLTANVLFESARRENVMMVPNAALRWAPAGEAGAARAGGPGGGGGGGGMGGGGGGPRGEGGGGGAGGGGGFARGDGAGGGGGGGGNWGGRRGGGQGRATSGPSSRPAGGGPRQWRQAKVWVRDGEGVKSIDVQAGLSDGTNTEVRGDGLSDGLEVVIGEVQPGSAGAAGATSTNPFVPQMPGRGGRRG
jgi:HlyD family secretion protein